MRLLLDTHVLLWALNTPARLGKARAEIADPANDILFSAASIWEIAIKSSLKRKDFSVAPNTVLSAALTIGFVELPVSSMVAALVAKMQHHHGDPFDRLLVPQAISEAAT